MYFLPSEWQLQEAKNKLSQLIKEVKKGVPQYITVHGRRTAVVLCAEEYDRLKRPRSPLSSALLMPVVDDSDDLFVRDADTGREYRFVKYLLDTVVVSEYIRRKPVQSVIDWLDEQEESHLYISSVTIAELKKGYYKLAYREPSYGAMERTKKIGLWIEKVQERFDNRILPIDKALLSIWANLCGQAEAQGRKLPIIDSLLVASAMHFDLMIITRNVADFKNCLNTVRIYNPY